MLGRAPAFWWRAPGLAALALTPPSLVYGAVARRNLERAPRAPVPMPVLCIGNLTVGGGGKTPTALALARAALRLGRRPGFLSRGHGGRSTAPVLVDPRRHGAEQVGDEPLLLAEVAPTVVAPDRLAGAALLRAQGCDFAIMDDGFQSARLRFDLALLVVDARRGIGNGRMLPAGPLRAPLESQLAHAQAIALVGDGPGGEALLAGMPAGELPVHRAALAAPNAAEFAGRRCLAFAGIADPEKFFASLRAAGAEIVASRAFPDHHVFRMQEARDLLGEADSLGLDLVTTAKDFARLRTVADGPVRGLARMAKVLETRLVFAEPNADEALVEEALRRFAARG